ncbi:MAG: phytanoyl-CoA dioxygenase family protein [Gemmataceae bacterium]|nr:phytanoyl-CoA dioxygenase family protein [Gemmataceae bacterium]
MTDWRPGLAEDGFALLPGVLSTADVAEVAAEWVAVCGAFTGDEAILADADGRVSGARALLRLWPRVVGLARRPGLLGPLLEVLGPAGGVVRALFFDKPPGHGWALPWHKDRTVAVAAHGPLGRFTKPTTKAGVPHVEAPEELLQRMVTARIHLDDVTPENGPLRVLPGSHRGDETRPPVEVHCRAGDVLLMRPLLTHASGHCDPATARHRRIVHLECAPSPDLSDGYWWHDFVRLGLGERGA